MDAGVATTLFSFRFLICDHLSERIMLVILLLGAAVAIASNCTSSLVQVKVAHDLACNSLDAGSDVYPWCRAPVDHNAKGDFPHLVLYMGGVVEALTSVPDDCDTKGYVHWLNYWMANSSVAGTWANELLVFQPGYFAMPIHRIRVETPWTLGLKCWAMSYLEERLVPLMSEMAVHMKGAFTGAHSFVNVTTRAAAGGVQQCHMVKANCFHNSTYQPAKHNNTCPLLYLEFHGGWNWQNLKAPSQDRVSYPF